MISNILIMIIVAFLGTIVYFAWQRTVEADKALKQEQQKVDWFKADFINYIAEYPNASILFPKLVKTPAGYRVEEGQGQNNSWWTLDEWFTEQHPYVAHVMKHTSHKMGGTDDDKVRVNPVYKLRRINPVWIALIFAISSCSRSINTTQFVDFNGTDTTKVRYATAAPATDFEGILLKVVDNGRVYPLPLCKINYGRQTWYDENDGKWIGVTFYEDGYTWTEFYHSFKDEDDLDPTFVRTIITDDYLVCSGGDDIAFPWTADEQREKTLTQFRVEWCRFGICELSTIVDGKKVVTHMDKRIVGQNRIPEQWKAGK